MGQKRTPAMVAKAKRMRADGRSYAEIAEELSKGGQRVSKAAVVSWLKDPSKASAASPPSAPVVPPELLEPPDETAMPPEDLVGLLTGLLRQQQTLARELTKNGDHSGAQRAARLMTSITAQIQKQQARDDDEGDSIRVSSSEMSAAAERARSKLHDLVSRLAEERSR